MKIISKFIFLLLLVFSLAGCGSFFGGDEAVGIASIETEELDDGSIKLVINYTNEDMPPVEVIIPKGEEGARGNGIKDIYTEDGDESTKVIVEFTDTSKGAEEFLVPHGAEIDKILVVDKEGNEIKTDENGNDYRVDEKGNSIEEEGQYYSGLKYLKILYTEFDSETEEQKYSIFELPQGKTGNEGNGIESIVAGKLDENGEIVEGLLNDDGSITIKFKYTQIDEPQMISIPPSKAILDVQTIDKGSSYQIDIIYTTKDSQGNYEKAEPIIFKKPCQWLSGTKAIKEIGNVGDYFYDEDDNQIYFKKPLANDPLGYWDMIVDFGQGTHNCVITFNANGGFILSGENNDIREDSVEYHIESGNYFYGSKTFPNVQHPDGLIFVGWYTTTDGVTVTPTSTKFTDLTIVNTDITLIAVWESK